MLQKILKPSIFLIAIIFFVGVMEQVPSTSANTVNKQKLNPTSND